MLLILEVFGGFVAMLAAGIAIVGDTWDKKKHGWNRFTETGRWVVFVAIVGFSISMTSSVFKYLDYLERQRAAIAEINNAWVTLMEPFKLMLWQIDGKQDVSSIEMINRILENKYLDKINNTINFQGEAPHHYGKWMNVICGSTSRGLDALRQSQTIYVGILDTNLIILTKDVVQSQAGKFMRILSPYDTVSYPDATKIQLHTIANLKEMKMYLIALKKLKVGMNEYE